MLSTRLCAALSIAMIAATLNCSAFARRVIQPKDNNRKTILIPNECEQPSQKPLKLTLQFISITVTKTNDEGVHGDFSAIALTNLSTKEGKKIPKGALVSGDFAPHGTDKGTYYFFRTIDFGQHVPLQIEASFEMKDNVIPIQRGKSVIFVKDAGPYYFVEHTPEFNEKYIKMHQGLKNFNLQKGDIFSVLIGAAQ